MLGHRTLTLEDYLTILKRRWMMIVIPTLVLPLLAFLISYEVTPVYTSQTLVLIEQQKVPDEYVKPIVDQNIDSRLASMKEQILSRSRLEPIIKQYGLENPKDDMDTRVAKVQQKDIEIKPIHSEISGAGGLPGFFISFKAGDAHTAQQVCRQIRSLFLTANLKANQDSAQGTTEFLQQQLDDAKSNLDAQDAKLAAFQRENIGTLPDDQSANMNMLTTLNSQLDASTRELTGLETDRSFRETILAQEGNGIPPTTGAGKGAPGRAAAQATPEQAKELFDLQQQLTALSEHYTADYPDVIAVKRRIQDLKKEIAGNGAIPGGAPGSPNRAESPGVLQLRAQLSALDDAIQQKRREQAQVQRQIGMYQSRMQSSPLVAAKYKELTRDYTTATKNYDDLLTKKNSSQMAASLQEQQQGEQFKIMDDANLPDQPTSPNRVLYMLGGLAAGLSIGFLLAAYLEYRDKSLRSERDVWAFTKLPTLGIIALSSNAPVLSKENRNWFRRRLKPENPPLANVGG
jgi:polysaccharide chain length determinant protein (PEP-CTERM system associated)